MAANPKPDRKKIKHTAKVMRDWTKSQEGTANKAGAKQMTKESMPAVKQHYKDVRKTKK